MCSSRSVLFLFHPNYRICDNQVGIGFSRDKVPAEVWYQQLDSLITCIYHKQWMPVSWAHSQGILLPKDPSKPNPCARSRLIFAFCPLGSSFFAQSQAQESTLVSDDTCHAYLPHRRRESAVLLAQTVPRRLEKAKFPFLDLLDKTNAFLVISKERSAHVAEDLVPAAAAQIARKFVMCHCFTLKCPDKACVFFASQWGSPRFTFYNQGVGSHFQTPSA